VESEQGTVQYTIDDGSIVLVGIRTPDGGVQLAADGRMWHAAIEATGKTSLVGVRIEFERTEWSGGLLWFSIVEDGYTVCPNCRKHIPPHLDARFCVFAKHPVKARPPTNGAHGER